MYRNLLKDTSLYSLSTILGRGFSLITVPIYTRFLSPSDYGALDLLSYLAMFLPLVLGLALDQAVARFYIDAETEIERKKIASTVIIYNALILFLGVGVGVLFAPQLVVSWLDNQVGQETVIMVFVLIWASALFSIANNQLKYMFEVKKYAVCNIGNTVLCTALSIWFIAFMQYGVFGVFLAQAISQFCFALLSLYYGRRAYGLFFDLRKFKTMLHYSLPLVPSAIAFFGMQYTDRYVLNALKELHDVGVYGIGARLSSLVFLFLTGFQGAWHPTVMKTYQDVGAKIKFKIVFNYFIFITTSILVTLSLFGQEVIHVLTTEAYSGGYVVVPLLVSAAILSSVGSYFSYGIQIGKKSKERLYINISGFVLNIILNVLFINWLGIIGAALATFTSFLLIASMSMIVSQKAYHVPYEWLKIISSLVLALAVSHVTVLWPMEISMSAVLFKLALTIVTFVLIGRILGIHGIHTMFSMIKQSN